MPMEPNDDLTPSSSRRRRRRQKSFLPIVLICAAAAILLGLVIFFFTWTPSEAEALQPTPTAAVSLKPTHSAVPDPPPTPTHTPAPEPEPVYDFTLPAPETEAAADGYFADAVFLGDSRTDGLKLFGGVNPDADFIEQTGIMVFEVDNPKKGVRVDGKQHSIMEALALKQYGKVYIMYGVNELGYGDDEAFEAEFKTFIDRVRTIQPNAVIYIQNLVTINPEKAAANSQPAYVNNEKIAVYNEILARVAAETRAVLVDVNAALIDPETGIIPKEGTSDGVHFSKDYYKKWYECLKTHTVDADLYWAGQSAEEGEET